MKTINITLSIAICFSLFHCNEEKNNLPPRIVNPLENRTLQSGFDTDTMDIQKVFNDPNDDKLFFNAKSSDDEVVSATIFQNSQLIIREGHAGKAKITLTANDAHRTTATDTLEVTIIKIVPDNQPPMVVNPLENRTLQAGFGTDTMDIQNVFNDPNDDALTFNAHSSDDSVIAVTIFQNNQLVIREGKVGKSKITLTANDVHGATATDTLEVNIIENVPENRPPMVVKPLENKMLQAGFDTDTMDIQNVFNDPNDDELTFNAHSSDDSVISVTIFQDNQLVIREGKVGKSKITLTANDVRGATATDTLEISIIKNVPENQLPMVVNPLENKTLQAGFGMDTIDIQHVFNDPNDDELTFNAHSSDDSVISVAIFQNNQLAISEVGVGISTITLTADDGQEGTVSDEFQVTVTERESLLACDFEVCPYDPLDRDKTVKFERELINVRATVLAHYGGKPGILGIRDGLHYKGYLVPCRPLDKEFIVDEKEVLISGYVLNCAGGLTLPQIKGSLGNLFKLTDIRNVPENQPPMVVNPLENKTLQAGFGMDTMDIQNVFNDPNNDALTFNAHSSNDEAVSVTILQNNQLVISEVGVGIATITLTADDGQGETASTTFRVTFTERESLLTCDFEVCPYELGASSRPVQIERELINVRAKIVKTNIIREYGITIDSFYLKNPGPSPFKHLPDPEGLAYLRLLVPCRMIDTRFRVNEKQIIISGYVLNCAAGLTLPNIRGSLGNLFELTDIRNVPENQPPIVVNPLENRTLQEGFGMDMVDIQNVFNDPNNDVLTFNAHSSNDEVASVTILQNNQLVISEVGTGIATITLTADDGQGETASTTFRVTVTENTIVVTPHDLTFTEGFGGQVVFLYRYFRSTNGDELNFIASISDPSVATVNIRQDPAYGTTLIINEVGNGTVTITVTANDSRGETASTTFKLTVIGRESLLACDFEVCPYELLDRGKPVQIARELINVRAKVVGGHHLTIDSFYLENPGPSPFKHFPGGAAYLHLLVPCRGIDTKFMVSEKQVIISGYVLNCSARLTLPNIRGFGGNLFKLTDIRNIPENQPPIVVNPLENRTLQEGFGTDMVDIQNVFSDPNNDALTFNAHSSNDEVASVTILQNNQLVISEVGTGIATITLTSDDGQGETATHTLEVSIIENIPENQPPIVVNPFENRTLQEGFGMDMVDIQNVFNDPNNDVLTFNAHSSNDEVASVTILQNNQLVISEVGVGIATITLTADDGQEGTVSDEFQVTVTERESLPLNDTIYGTWKMVEFYDNDLYVRRAWISSPVKDGIEYTFKRDGSFKSSRPTIFHEKCFPSHFKIFNHRDSSVSNKLISMSYSCLKKDVDEQFLNFLNERDRRIKSAIGNYNTGDLNLYTLIDENHILFNDIAILWNNIHEYGIKIKNNRLSITRMDSNCPEGCFSVFQKISE